jgi:hypothetical protein
MSEVAEKAKVRKTTNIKRMSADELRILLAEREAKEAREKVYRTEKQAWRAKKDDWIKAVLLEAVSYQEFLKKFKENALTKCEELYDEYFVTISGNDKSKRPDVFTLTTEDDSMRVEFDASDLLKFDETAQSAVTKIHTWLETKFKGREETKVAYSIINQALSKNKLGQYNPLIVYKLKKVRDRDGVRDVEFVNALEELEQSLKQAGKASYIRFYQKDENNKWENITLQFSAL